MHTVSYPFDISLFILTRNTNYGERITCPYTEIHIATCNVQSKFIYMPRHSNNLCTDMRYKCRERPLYRIGKEVIAILLHTMALPCYNTKFKRRIT